MSSPIASDKTATAAWSHSVLPPGPLASRTELVDQLTADARLCVVRGPLGSGKTTLAALAARADAAAGRRIVWVEAHAGEGAEDLWVAVLAETTGDGGTAPMPDATSRRGPVEALRSALAGAATPVTLVLDAVDRVDDPRLPQQIAELLTGAAGLRIIVTTRRRLALESRSTRARVSTTVVGPRLGLSADDVAELLTGRTPRPLRERLVHVTAGHALTLRIVLLALADDGQHPGTVPITRLADLARDAAREIVEAVVAPGDLDRISRIAVPGRLTLDLAEVAGGEKGREAIDRAEALGLGFWHDDELAPQGPDVFELLEPVRGVLHDHLRETDPELLFRLAREVVDEALEQGAIGVAGFAALEARNTALLDRTCREAWTHPYGMDFAALSEIAHDVGTWQVEGFPSLALALGFAYRLNPVRSHLAPRMFELAANGVALANPTGAAERGYLSTVQSMALRFLGDIERARLAAEDAIVAIRTAQSRGEEMAGLGFLMRNLAASLFAAGDTPTAMVLLEEAHTHETSGTSSELLTRLLRALVLTWAGEIETAEGYLRDLPTEPDDILRLGGYAARVLLDTRSIIALERDDREGYDDAQEVLLAVPRRPEEFTALEAIYRATRSAYAGDLAGALATLDQTLAPTSGHAIAAAWRERLLAVRTLVRAALGNPLATGGEAGEADSLHDEFAVLMRTAALVASDHLPLAETSLRTATPEGRPQLRESHPEVALRILAFLLEAVLAARVGTMHAARRHALSAASLTRASGSRRMWVALTAQDRHALEALLPGGAPDNLDTPFPQMLGDSAAASSELTPREILVLHELGRGASTRATAEALGVSVNTIKTQLRSLYRKLEASTREEALRRARELELI